MDEEITFVGCNCTECDCKTLCDCECCCN